MDGRNFALGHFFPQSRHLVRLAHKIGKVRYSTKIQTENVFFGKTNLRGLLRKNWAKFSSGTFLPLNAPYSQLGQEKRYGPGFIKKFLSDANLNRHALRPSKQYWITCPRKVKSEFDRTPQPNVYKWNANWKYKDNRPRPNDYERIMNRRYKSWTPQGRILYKFTSSLKN